jgi:hypothetical protein
MVKMIDYEKLLEANELLMKSKKHHVGFYFGYPGDYDEFTIYDNEGGPMIDEIKGVDDLIAKLRELTKPEPKYKEGEYVWLMGINNLPVDCCIEDVDPSSNEKYLIDDAWFTEEELYPSREALIDAQIEYWKGMKHEQIVPVDCEHEHDGGFFDLERDMRPRCKHCGEFYR